MRKNTLLFTTAALLWSTPVMAAHPLITDDTGTQGPGHFQIELNGGYASDTRTAAGIPKKTTGVSTGTTLTFGISETVDLIAGLPWQWSRVESDGTSVAADQGIGDLSIQIKWRVLENQEKNLSLAIRPGLSVPTGDPAKGFGTGRVSGGMMMIATSRNAVGALHANAGYLHNEYGLESLRDSSRCNLWHASLAGELNMAPGLRSVANIGIDTNQERSGSTNPAFLIGGLIWSPERDVDLDIGIRKGLNDDTRSTNMLAGMTARF